MFSRPHNDKECGQVLARTPSAATGQNRPVGDRYDNTMEFDVVRHRIDPVRGPISAPAQGEDSARPEVAMPTRCFPGIRHWGWGTAG